MVAEKRQIRGRSQKYTNREDKIELNSLTNLIYNENIGEFRSKNFDEDVHRESESDSIWKLANRINNDNSSIQEKNGVIFDARGKATAVVECLQGQLSPNEADVAIRTHYKQVRRRVQLFRNTSFETSIQPVSGNEVRNVIKNLKNSKVPGHDEVTKSMVKQLNYHVT
jgi:hypothetical protein